MVEYKFDKLYIALLYVFVAASGAYAQDAAALKRATGYVQQAEQYYEDARYDRSIQEYQFAATIYRQTGNFDKYAICYNGVGNNYINLTRFDDAYAEFRRVMANFDEIKQKKPDFVPDSMLVADAYEGFGRFYNNKNSQFDSALVWHQRALDIRLRTVGERHAKTALSYYFIGLCYRGIKLDSAQIAAGQNNIILEEQYLEKALRIQLAVLDSAHAQLADTYQALGDYNYDVLLDYLAGYEYHKKALWVRERRFKEAHPSTALTYLNLAKYNRVISEYAAELSYLEKALRLQESIFGLDHKDVGTTLYALADRYRISGDVERALSYFERAEKIMLARVGAEGRELAEIYIGIANCYGALDNYQEQRVYLRRVLALWQKTYGKQHQQIGVAYTQLGNYFLAQNSLDSALYYHNLAITLWKNTLGDNHIWVAEGMEAVAKVYAVKGDSEKEFFYLNEALRRKKSSSAASTNNGDMLADDDYASNNRATPTQLYESYLNLSKFYLQKKDYKLGLAFCQSALGAIFGSVAKSSGDIYQNPTILELSRNIAWLDVMHLKGSLLLLEYKEGSHKEKDLQFAVQTFDHTMRLIDTLRINFTADASKEQLTKRSIPIYEGALEAQHLLYQNTKDGKHIETAFSIMEHSKAFVLMQAIQNTQAKNAGIVPQELFAKEELLRQNLAYYSDYKNRNKDNASAFDKTYFDTKRSYDSLINYIETNYPKYYQLKYAQPDIKLKDIQEKILRPKDAILEYFIGDQNVYVFCIQKTKVQFYKAPFVRKEQQNINILRNNLTNYKFIVADPQAAFREFVDVSHEVYKYYFAPFAQHISPENTERLIVIPDGMLSYVPFEVFMQEATPADQQAGYRDLKMLIRTYEITYSYSSSLLLQNLQAAHYSHNGKCLGFAPTYSHAGTGQATNADLPWAEKELKAIEQTFKGQFILGAGATKQAFLQQSRDYAVIHLAMHGIVDWRNAQRSHLAFATIAGDSSGDAANLYNFEIQNLSLRADLVVLSACETGFGKMIRGEGVLSLARGFMLAGVPSIITTLWQVNDYTSATLMTYFYENLEKGMDKPTALHQAKLRFLAQTDKTSGHPAFWASFVSLGDPAPIRRAWGWLAWLTVSVISLSLLAAAYFALRRYKNNRLENKPTDAFRLNTPHHDEHYDSNQADQTAAILAHIRERAIAKVKKN
jgi:CHAT domain-containing protein